MKLEGKWYLSIFDETKTSTDTVSEVEIIEGTRFIRYKSAGKVYLTSYPAKLREAPESA